MSAIINIEKLRYIKANERDSTQITNLLMQTGGDRQNVSADQFLIACNGDLILGCIRIKHLEDGTLELASLGVLPKYRNGGIGSNLISKILKLSDRRPIYLLCLRERENFYNRFGFVLTNFEKLPTLLKKEYKRASMNFPTLNKEIIVMKLV